MGGGAYDINRLAYMGGGYEYRKYSMGSMTVLGINRLGDSQNTIYLKDWQDGRFGISLSGQEDNPEKPQSSPTSVTSLAGNDVDVILNKDAADGGQGNDFLQGTAGQSVLAGGMGNDILNGMDGDDWLEGGEGNDIITTGKGSDVAYGGARFDAFNTPQSTHHQCTTNSIARRADLMQAKCSKRLRNRATTSLKRCTHRKDKPNQRLTSINAAQSATEVVVSSYTESSPHRRSIGRTSWHL